MSIIITLNGKSHSEVQATKGIAVDWKDLVPELKKQIRIRDYEEIIGVEASEGFLDVKVARIKHARSKKVSED